MEKGDIVRLKGNPGRVGSITGRKRERSNKIYWQVRFPDFVDYYREIHLEPVLLTAEDPLDFLEKGRFGIAQDLRGNLTHIRLTGRLANLIYSMDTTNTDFYPYQFKPVLNFLDAPSDGLLIADEVGLGKTIEAGLIWTELKSRYDIRRAMVLCPAMLQQKWQDEMRFRFGINAEILNSKSVLDYLKDTKLGKKYDFSIITSMQGLRPRKGWENNDSPDYYSSILARFLHESQFDGQLIDLLIIDEAHYLRNPNSMTSQLGRLLRNISEHIILLSATPVHLKSLDLYQLLNLVDENTFNQPQVFDAILNANSPILRARDAVLHGNICQLELVELLAEAIAHPFLRTNRQIISILKSLPTDEQLKDTSFKTSLAYRLEKVNLLNRVVNRTRKRDVTSWRVLREAIAERVSMTEVEHFFYNQVTDLVRKYSKDRGGMEAFLLVSPQRQMSSSMPAALIAWHNKRYEYQDELYEDIGLINSNKELGPLTKELIDNACNIVDLNDIIKNDTKYFRLLEVLTNLFKKYPTEKVILFSYFRHTIRYLKDRLTKDGIASSVLMGGDAIDRYELISNFQSNQELKVLLSTEIASEGIDLQFCRYIINYDLPWNPMKVEQRIGRIDRLGQRAKKITIWNLFYQDTIDEKIYSRLYKRIGIFEHALGGLEAVLGDEIQKLTSDLLRKELNPEQENNRIAQTEQAISYLKVQENKLEEEANNLIAHGEYILHQIKAARELQRTISSYDIWIYLYDFFKREYVGTEFVQIEPDKLLFDINLSVEAKWDFEKYLKKNRIIGHTKLFSPHANRTRCIFKNQVGNEEDNSIETINQFHPLVRFVSDKITNSSFKYFSPVSVKLEIDKINDLEPDIYVFHVEKWSIRGIRDIEHMHVEACKFYDRKFFLDENKAEKIVTISARFGTDWVSAKNDIDLNIAVEIAGELIDRAEKKYDLFVEQIDQENNDRADIQEKSLNSHKDRQIEKLERIKNNQLSLGKESIVRMTQGRINALTNRMDLKLKEINERKKLNYHKQSICMGVITIS